MEIGFSRNYFFVFCVMLFLVLSNTQISSAASLKGCKTQAERKVNELYVSTACSATTYPDLCEGMFYRYASLIKSDPVKLCRAALALTLKTTVKVYNSISKIRKREGLSEAEAGILRDCMEEIRDTFDEIKESIGEIKRLKGAEAKAQLENVKTWVSAALTDEDTCVSGFDERPEASSWLKKEVKEEVEKLEKVTSNTLSLINDLRY